MDRTFLRFESREDITESLELAAKLIQSVPHEETAWKWVLIALHHAVRLVLADTLRAVSLLGPLDFTALAGMIAWVRDSRHNPDLKRPDEKLASFDELLARATDRRWMAGPGSRPLALSESERADLHRLDTLCRGFDETAPEAWWIERQELLGVVATAVRLVEELVLEHTVNRRRFDDAGRERVRRALDALRAAVS